MFAYEVVVTFIFRLINMAVLGGLGLWAYRKYGRKMVETKLNARDTLLQGLQEQSYMLEARYAELQDDFSAQQELAKRLEHKVLMWHEAVTAQATRCTDEYAQLERHLQHKYQQKRESIVRQRAYAQQLAQALGSARTILQERFAQPDVANTYLKSLIEGMGKEAHGPR